MVSYFNLVLFINLSFNFIQADFEFYSASEHLKILLNTQDKLIKNIDSYLVREKKRHYVLTKYLKRYKHDYHTTIKNPKRYFGNPINVFTFLKRLTVDVTSFEKKIVELTPYTILSNLTFDLPSETDVQGVTKGLVRLLTTYLLNITDVADGVTQGKNKDGERISQSVTPLSVTDLYDMGNVLFNLKDYKSALPWVLEAHQRYKPEHHDIYPFKFKKLIEFISFCYNSIGDFETSVSWLQLLVNLDPDDDRAVKLFHSRKRYLDFEQTQATIAGKTDKPEEIKEIGESKRETEIYQSLCRGEGKLTEKLTKKLKCQYMSEISPYFTIGPLKVEQLYISPDIYRFHDIISDEDIQELKDIFKERLKRENKNESESHATDYEVSKSTWLDDNYRIANKLSRLVSDVTGLDTRFSEPLRVTNYGFAGWRMDFIKLCDKNLLDMKDNRMSTFFFYLSDVELGGATVFIEAGLTVYPEKGDAIYFDNTQTTVYNELATLHAACPVIIGEKWVATKWISEVGNEFIRPCYVSALKRINTRKFNLIHF